IIIPEQGFHFAHFFPCRAAGFGADRYMFPATLVGGDHVQVATETIHRYAKRTHVAHRIRGAVLADSDAVFIRCFKHSLLHWFWSVLIVWFLNSRKYNHAGSDPSDRKSTRLNSSH